MAMKAVFSSKEESKEEKPQKKSKAKPEAEKVLKRRKDADGNSIWYKE
jgi:hypothetical protein